MKTGYTLQSESAAHTLALGRILGEVLESGDIVALEGELGSGKTCLTQGIARGLGVPPTYAVTSPTFTLVNEYPGRLVLYHLDVYRLAGPRDLEDMGCEEYLFGGGVAVIEWAEKVRKVLPEETLWIEMTWIDETKRRLVLSGDEKRMKIIQIALKDGGF
jgi:tRNA threonylcarbamoyladenosine biosynthesis protein TsaE